LKIVIATADSLTARMAGPAIRAWHVAATLAAEHEVRLVSTAACTVEHPEFTTGTAGLPEQMEALEQWCDVFMFQGFIMDGFPFLRRSSKVLVVDVYDPLHLEQLEQTREADPVSRERIVRDAVAILNEQLLRGDFFLCASTKQRDLWVGHLSALGRVNPRMYDEHGSLGHRLVVVPFGLPDEPPVAARRAIKGVIPGIDADDEVILWGGGIYNWFDPLTLIRAVGELRVRRPKVRLFFMGLKHPNPNIPEMRMAVDARRLADELELTGTHVFFNEGWVPYDERQEYLLDADIGVSTHLDHLETEFSFRTRILDYLWAGLPVIATQGDAFADLIERRDLGITVPPQDVAALSDALFRLLDDPELAAACRKHVADIAPEFAWSRVLAPLVEFCRHPTIAPDRADPGIAYELRRAEQVMGKRRGITRDLYIAVGHLRRGGPKQLMGKAISRVGPLRERLAPRTGR
jgi:glycosyltransferase involved in cell wall biosynthesis